jgi:pimeloyl-ACP methyl ester carboxylesterase
MHVLALEIARRFPDSITLMIKGDSEVVADVARYLYEPGDKLYLIGHSQGGAAIADAAVALKEAGVPIELLAEQEGFLAYDVVPRNVVQAFNFYVPTTFSICPGRATLKAEDAVATRVSNIPIDDPWGPFNGACAPHRNIDSDPRVWKTVLQYILESAPRAPDTPNSPANAATRGR